MKKAFTLIGLLIVYLYLAPKAGHLGSVWNSHTYPTRNVTVELADGTVERGALMYNMDRSYTLRRADGSELTFRDFQVMEFSKPKEGSTVSARTLLPITVLTVIYVLILLRVGWNWLPWWRRFNAA